MQPGLWSSLWRSRSPLAGGSNYSFNFPGGSAIGSIMCFNVGDQCFTGAPQTRLGGAQPDGNGRKRSSALGQLVIQPPCTPATRSTLPRLSSILCFYTFQQSFLVSERSPPHLRDAPLHPHGQAPERGYVFCTMLCGCKILLCMILHVRLCQHLGAIPNGLHQAFSKANHWHAPRQLTNMGRR